MATIYTIVNQKGGVGKTTTAINLAHGLARAGFKVLGIDFDPQSCFSSWLGIPPGNGVYSLLTAGMDNDLLPQIVKMKVMYTGRENFWIIPSDKDLIDAQRTIFEKPVHHIKTLLNKQILANTFDCIVIDTAPTVGGLQQRAIWASDYLIVPVQANYGGVEGFMSLYNDMEDLHAQGWKGHLLGVLPTMYDERTEQTEVTAMTLAETFKGYESAIFDPIHRATILEKCAERAQSIFEIAPSSRAAEEYQRFVDAVIKYSTH